MVSPLLQYLNLGDNLLSSSIDISTTSLRSLFLYDNLLTGTLPASTLPHLQRVRLQRNWISGTLPSSWTRVVEVWLAKNALHGALPTTWTEAQDLNANSNRLTGTLPTTLTLLTWLDLHNNNLSGNLQPLLQLKHLQVVKLSDNYFQGTIPVVMPVPDMAWFHGNPHLDGTLPESYCHATSLSADCHSIACPCCTLCCDGDFCWEPTH
jgi:hypothetical protein